MAQQPQADQQTFNNELRGVLFRNDKGDNPQRPDYRGTCQIDGDGYRMSGWVRQARATGKNFLTIAFTRDETLDVKDAKGFGTSDVLDDIPF